MKINTIYNNACLYQNKRNAQPNFKSQTDVVKDVFRENIANPKTLNILRFGNLENINKCLAEMTSSITAKLVNTEKYKNISEINIRTENKNTIFSIDNKQIGMLTRYDKLKGDRNSGITYWDEKSNKLIGLTTEPNDTFHLYEIDLS